MVRAMPGLHYGTSSWSEKSWVGSFYPPGTKPGDMLTYYASRFATVEADNTYYRVPPRAMVRGWREKTPPGFRLAAKFPRSVVHAGAGEKPDATKVLLPDHVGAAVDAFLAAMSELGDRPGPLVLQFPYFNQTAFRGPEEFLARLDPFLARLPRDFRYGVEVRNKNWVGAPLLDMLRAHRVAFVLVDLVYMPHPADLAQRFDLVTTDFTYARLIGDRKAVEARTETFDRIVLDQSASLERWAAYLSGLLPRIDVYTYANNHYAGHGPATIRELVERIEALRA
jgi:uncharacterized protein YecE (DUF72 family)